VLGQGPDVDRGDLLVRGCRGKISELFPQDDLLVVLSDGILILRNALLLRLLVRRSVVLRSSDVLHRSPHMAAEAKYVHCGVRRLQSRLCRVRVFTSPTRFAEPAASAFCCYMSVCGGLFGCRSAVGRRNVRERQQAVTTAGERAAWTAGRSAAHSRAGFWSRCEKRAPVPS